MRETLFRGKPVYKKDYALNKNVKCNIGYFKDGFAYGFLIVVDDTYFICTGIADTYFIHTGVAGISISSIDKTMITLVEVDPKTVGQFTDLTDKNGKKIFEGDIVERFWLGDKHTYLICYDNDIASFIGKDICSEYLTTFDYDACKFEVIGNIHDNPELLEV